MCHSDGQFCSLSEPSVSCPIEQCVLLQLRPPPPLLPARACVCMIFFFLWVFGCVAGLDRLWLGLFFLSFCYFWLSRWLSSLCRQTAVGVSAEFRGELSGRFVRLSVGTCLWPDRSQMCCKTSADCQSQHLYILKQDVWCFDSFGSVKFLKGLWIVNTLQGFFFSLSPAPCGCRNRCIRLI